MKNDRPKLYTVHTAAPYEVVSEIVQGVAMHHGYMAILNETPDGSRIIAPSRPLGRARWLFTFFALASAPFALHYLTRHSTGQIAAIQGFGLGWICAALILTARRLGYRISRFH
jgi:hypothetical protein